MLIPNLIRVSRIPLAKCTRCLAWLRNIRHFDSTQIAQIGDSHLFSPLSVCFLFSGAAYGQWAKAATQFAFELAEKRVAGEGPARVRVEAERSGGFLVVGLGQHLFPVYTGDEFLPRIEVEQMGCVRPTRVRGRAGPPVGPWRARHLCADGIALDVAHRGDGVGLVHGTRVEASLPEVPTPAMEPVDVLRIDEMGAPDGKVQRFFARRSGDKVDVVGHEAVSQHADPMFAALLTQQVEVGNAVGVYEEHVLLVVPTLGDMVGQSGYDDSRVSWHGKMVAESAGEVNK